MAKKYPCRHCSKSFITKEKLYEHLKVWHRHLKRATQSALLKASRQR